MVGRQCSTCKIKDTLTQYHALAVISCRQCLCRPVGKGCTYPPQYTRIMLERLSGGVRMKRREEKRGGKKGGERRRRKEKKRREEKRRSLQACVACTIIPTYTTNLNYHELTVASYPVSFVESLAPADREHAHFTTWL